MRPRGFEGGIEVQSFNLFRDALVAGGAAAHVEDDAGAGDAVHSVLEDHEEANKCRWSDENGGDICDADKKEIKIKDQAIAVNDVGETRGGLEEAVLPDGGPHGDKEDQRFHGHYHGEAHSCSLAAGDHETADQRYSWQFTKLGGLRDGNHPNY